MNHFKLEKTKTKLRDYPLLEEATELMSSENYKEALHCLEKSEIAMKSNSKGINHILSSAIQHNIAFCYYKLGRLNNTFEYLQLSHQSLKEFQAKNENAAENLQILKILSEIELQLCALSSQKKQHEKALKYAQNSLKHIKELFVNLSMLVSQYSFAQKHVKKNPKFIDTITKVACVLDKIISKKYAKKICIYAGEL